MGFFDRIFRSKTKARTEYENLPSFWEDDYCQIEIIPGKNMENVNSSIRQIEELTKNTRTAYGFTDIYCRKELSFSTLNEEISVDHFEKLFAEKGFEQAKQIRYDGYTIIDCSKNTSNALSLPCFNFFYDCKDEFINNIWISASLVTSTEHFKVISDTLYELGEGYDLVLINWNSLELINLADKKQIENYLMSYWK